MPVYRDEKGRLVVVAGASEKDSDWLKQNQKAKEADIQAHSQAQKQHDKEKGEKGDAE